MSPIKKISLSFVLFIILGIFYSGLCQADSDVDFLSRREYGIGWQFSKPASGLSLKIPLLEDSYLQPIVAFSMKDRDQNFQKHFAAGIRGIYDFQPRRDFKPYAGVSLGYSEDSASGNNQMIKEGGFGYEGFFGVEYQKYLLRPALEIGMGGYRYSDQSYYAGVSINISLLYYF